MTSLAVFSLNNLNFEGIVLWSHARDLWNVNLARCSREIGLNFRLLKIRRSVNHISAHKPTIFVSY